VTANFFGGAAPATPPPPPPSTNAFGDFDYRLYIILISVLFAASVLANSNGFFNPS
jgi:hypothetical protein